MIWDLPNSWPVLAHANDAPVHRHPSYATRTPSPAGYTYRRISDSRPTPRTDTSTGGRVRSAAGQFIAAPARLPAPSPLSLPGRLADSALALTTTGYPDSGQDGQSALRRAVLPRPGARVRVVRGRTYGELRLRARPQTETDVRWPLLRPSFNSSFQRRA